jgi:hypothetical protein
VPRGVGAVLGVGRVRRARGAGGLPAPAAASLRGRPSRPAPREKARASGRGSAAPASRLSHRAGPGPGCAWVSVRRGRARTRSRQRGSAALAGPFGWPAAWCCSMALVGRAGIGSERSQGKSGDPSAFAPADDARLAGRGGRRRAGRAQQRQRDPVRAECEESVRWGARWRVETLPQPWVNLFGLQNEIRIGSSLALPAHQKSKPTRQLQQGKRVRHMGRNQQNYYWIPTALQPYSLILVVPSASRGS